MKEQIAQRAKSKTYNFGLIIILLGYLQQNHKILDTYLGDNKDLVLFLIGMLILLFRELTTSSLSEKGKPP